MPVPAAIKDAEVASRSNLWWRRAAAVFAIASASLHAAALTEHTSTASMVTAVTAAMIVGCLVCARDLWKRGSPRVWGLVALMNIGMIAGHFALMPLGTSTSHQSHSGSTIEANTIDHSSMFMNTSLIAAVIESTVAVVVLFYRTRTYDPATLMQ